VVSRALAWGAAGLGLALGGSRAPGLPAGLPDWVAAATARWDALHFASVARHGYPAGPGEAWAFMPGFPLAARGLGAVLGSLWAGGIAVSVLAFAGALVLLGRLVALDSGAAAGRRAVWLMALFPASVFATAFYSEGVFLLATIGAVYAARRERWAWAGAAGAVAALTRQTGVLVLIPLAGLAWTAAPRPRARDLASLALVPAALGAVLLYAAVHAGDALAPWHAQAIWGRAFHGPFSAVVDALGHPLGRGGFEPGWMGPLGLAFLALGAVGALGALARGPAVYGLYALAVLAVPLSAPWPEHPLMSLPRFVLAAFPVFGWLALVTGRRAVLAGVLVVLAVGLALFSARFGMWLWIA
jgi:hypothetical protein